MATFDIVSYIVGMIGLMFIIYSTSFCAGRDGWTSKEFFATLAGQVLWSHPAFSKKVWIGLWVFSIVITWLLGMTWCLWSSIVIVVLAMPVFFMYQDHVKEVAF
jgi:hypothetical protein